MVAPVVLAEIAGLDVSRRLTVKLRQMVLLQVPSALTKYVVAEAGDTTTLLPVAMDVPPQLPLYHFQLAPVPRVPPLTLSVVDVPKQIMLEPVMDVAGIELSLTVTVTDRQMVVLQIPSALTK
jgi:hypothetical protein